MSSTVLYEAISYNTNILILNDEKYYDYSKPLVDNYGARYFNNSNELYYHIISLLKMNKTYNNNYFFESNATKNMLNSINSILNE